MKTRIIPFAALTLFSCMPALIQFSEDDNLVQVYEGVPGTKDELYLKSNNWMIETFNDAESVIQHNDKEDGVIIGKYKMSGIVTTGMYGGADSRVYAIIDIRVKDNKARIEIKPQGQWRYDASGMSIYNYSRQDAIADMQRLADDFHAALEKSTVEF